MVENRKTQRMSHFSIIHFIYTFEGKNLHHDIITKCILKCLYVDIICHNEIEQYA